MVSSKNSKNLGALIEISKFRKWLQSFNYKKS